MNELDNPRSRKNLRAMPTVDSFIRQSSRATELTIIAGTPIYGLGTTVYNCEYSTVSGLIIWLQERGVTIPADICAELEIAVKDR